MPVIQHGDQEIHLSHDEEEKLNNFQVITTFPEDSLPQIVKLLQDHGWQLEPALSRYFDGNWQENLNPPPVAARPHTPPVPQRPFDSTPFLFGDSASLVPRLPLVKRLPLDFKERFRYAGLDKRPNEFNTHPALFLLVLLPKVLFKIGTGIFTLLWSIISFGFRTEGVNASHIHRVPDSPLENEESIHETLESIFNGNTELSSLVSPKSFNEVYEECEKEFKFLLVVCLGDVGTDESSSRDVNSRLFIESILNEPSTLQLLRENSENMVIYMRSAQDMEMWSLCKQLRLRYTPECLLIGNVLNSKDSVNGATRMSVLSRLKVGTLRKFQNSLKVVIERHSAELIVSRSEQEELRMAREIKQMQDQAYQESLRHDQEKEQKRQAAEAEAKAKREAELIKELEFKTTQTIQQLCILNFCLDNLEPLTSSTITQEKQATLQIRTPNGKRFVKKFNGASTLEYIYKVAKCFLFLNLENFNKDHVLKCMATKVKEMAEDEAVLCFKDGCNIESLRTDSQSEELHKILQSELPKWSMPNREVDLDIDFELVTPFPRFKLPNDKNALIKNTQQIWPNGSILVEYLEDAEQESE
ncbi:LAQU0S10e00540g1_1 [Lachancea quebecensis]|uniref:LAQU0S10e00540g1_1 n=1 Tax=Lachancea quebecensis TaxID=1654605 RepID=A0A0P1L0K9_9SACH|nr:LAQU0S10e00540g1_1 [Lachancea quebecensis]